MKASDGPRANGLYTEAILRTIKTPNLTIDQVFNQVNAYVRRESGGEQVPFKNSSLESDFYFRISKSQKPEPYTPPKDLPVGPAMVFVRGGVFDMGSTEGEADEKPVHTVTVSNFSMAKYETTVEEFAHFVAETNYKTDAEKLGTSRFYNFSSGKWQDTTGVNWRYGADLARLSAVNYNHPVVHVSNNDAVAYCEWLTKKTGRTYRLPTEAEWEYASGNGLKHTKYSWGSSPTEGVNGNVSDETGAAQFNWAKNMTNIFLGYTDSYAYTAPVGKFKANDFGLYDMTGNVLEWCADWYGADYYANSSSSNPVGTSTGSSRVYRGGCWSYSPALSRVANRIHESPSYRDRTVGFRVVSLQ
jgi:formylglycine-generating enzyme required for sulfatase activity